MKDSITHQEHLQLQGLVLLAAKGVDRTDELMRAIAALLEVDPNGENYIDEVCDPIWGRVPEAHREILRKLRISVQPREGDAK